MRLDWKKKYVEVARNFSVDREKTFLSGFNANIDRVFRADEVLTRNPEEEDLGSIESYEDLLKVLKYCKENGKNKEIDIESYKPEIEGGETYIGGQGGIVSTFCSRIGTDSVIYTPFISEKLSEAMDSDIKTKSCEENSFTYIENALNSEKTKENMIFEFQGDKTGRLILSDSLEGFEPVFMEDDDFLDFIDEKVDRFFFSGFHHISNEEIDTAKEQLKYLDTSIHLEYVYNDEDKARKIVNNIFPFVESIGCDGDEMEQIMEVKGMEKPQNTREYIEKMEKIARDSGIERFHVHTYNFHMCMVRKGYGIDVERVLDSMLFGELCAIASADKGDIPYLEDIRNFSMNNKHLKGEGKVRRISDNGIIEKEDFYVLMIPIIIHEKPERLVGLGDLISSGSFFSEVF